MSWADRIATASKRIKLTRSTNDGVTVDQSPEALLSAARRKARALANQGVDLAGSPDLTQDEYSLARVIHSEHASGSPVAQACIGDEALNRAGGGSIHRHVAPGNVYGRQGAGRPTRPVSTRADPSVRALIVARSVLSGEARGVSRGAVRYFDPRTQWRQYNKSKLPGSRTRTTCPPTGTCEKWTYDLPGTRVKRIVDGRRYYYACPFDRSRPGRSQLEWVGPIAGVDHTHLLLFRRRQSIESQRERFRQSMAICKAIEETLPIPQFLDDAIVGTPFEPLGDLPYDTVLLAGGVFFGALFLSLLEA